VNKKEKVGRKKTVCDEKKYDFIINTCVDNVYMSCYAISSGSAII